MKKKTKFNWFKLIAIIIVIQMGSGSSLFAQISSLSLEEAKKIAIINNRDLKILRLNLQIAKEKSTEARAKAYPQLNSSLTYNINDQPKNLLRDRDYSQVTISVDQTLFHLGIWAGIKAAKQFQKVEGLSGDRFQETLFFLVTETYLKILTTQKQLDVLKELEKNTQEHLRNAQNFYNEGMVPKTDLLKTELALNRVQRDLLTGNNEQQKLQTAFKILLGTNLDQDYQLQEVELQDLPIKDIKELQQEAIGKRNDLKVFLAKASYLENIRKAYQSRRYPNLSAFGSWNYTADKFEAREHDMAGGIRLTMPIFNGFGITAQVAQAKSHLVQNQLQYEQLKAQVNQEVEVACLDIKEARTNLEIAQKEVKQAEENLRITNDLYKEAMSTTTDVIDAQTLLAQARNHFNSARYGQILANQRLLLAVGGS
ncbi:MAG: TolC family protein [bacterium]